VCLRDATTFFGLFLASFIVLVAHIGTLLNLGVSGLPRHAIVTCGKGFYWRPKLGIVLFILCMVLLGALNNRMLICSLKWTSSFAAGEWRAEFVFEVFTVVVGTIELGNYESNITLTFWSFLWVSSFFKRSGSFTVDFCE
jgi:hypothetical protein